MRKTATKIGASNCGVCLWSGWHRKTTPNRLATNKHPSNGDQSKVSKVHSQREASGSLLCVTRRLASLPFPPTSCCASLLPFFTPEVKPFASGSSMKVIGFCFHRRTAAQIGKCVGRITRILLTRRRERVCVCVDDDDDDDDPYLGQCVAVENHLPEMCGTLLGEKDPSALTGRRVGGV